MFFQLRYGILHTCEAPYKTKTKQRQKRAGELVHPGLI
jgi:hypothetical protein